MKEEVQSAVNFLAKMLSGKHNKNIHPRQLKEFGSTLGELLKIHYQEHWFPDKPIKGSAYRCIRINHNMDPILKKAGLRSGFNEEDLREKFPNELTLWVDPREVSYRIGENGSICVLYDAKMCPAAIATTIDVTTPDKLKMRNDDGMDSGFCSPMSGSPPSPTTAYHRFSTSCKAELHRNVVEIIEMNSNFVDFVSS